MSSSSIRTRSRETPVACTCLTPRFLAALEPGHRLILDDGKVMLKAEHCTPKRAECRVVVGGKLSDRKGVSLPDTTLPVSALTDKDRSDLGRGAERRCRLDRRVFRAAARGRRRGEEGRPRRAAVMAKIEKPQAVTRLAEIMDIADALMVARGDLAWKCRWPRCRASRSRSPARRAAPASRWLVATQMLESMISAPFPPAPRSPTSATAVFEGADAIMLSAESAAGQYPVEAVAMMNRIAEEVEADPT